MLLHALPPDPLPMTMVSSFLGTFSGENGEARIGDNFTFLPGHHWILRKSIQMPSKMMKSHQGGDVIESDVNVNGIKVDRIISDRLTIF